LDETSGLVAALAKAKLAMKPPKKGRTAVVPTKAGGKYEYHYADRADVIESYSKALSDNGLALSHALGRDEKGGLELVTTVRHEGGGEIASRVPLPATDNAQTLGSWLTYLERYQSCALLDIAAEDDDDGQRATAKDEPADVRTLPFLDLRQAIQDAADELAQRGGGTADTHIKEASGFDGTRGRAEFSDPFDPKIKSEKWLKSVLGKLTAKLNESEPGAREASELFK
jgi:hypothetical protein